MCLGFLVCKLGILTCSHAPHCSETKLDSVYIIIVVIIQMFAGTSTRQTPKCFTFTQLEERVAAVISILQMDREAE